MGNQVLKDHKVEKQPIACGGPGLAWKIYPARTKQTDEEVSIWVFDKKAFTLDKSKKNELNQFVDLLKKDAQLLVKLRHPHILRLRRPLEETKTNLVLETEPIVASLANVLGKNYSNFGMCKSSDTLTQAQSTICTKYTLEDMEIKIGLLNICEALAFLHQTTQMFHLNISPENIFISKDGSWKLGGFAFAIPQSAPVSVNAPVDYATRSFTSKSEPEHFPLRQNLDYLAPETIYAQTVSSKSDMFALGCLIYELYTKQSLINCNNDIALYKQRVANIFPLNLDKIPMSLHGTLEKLLAADPRTRLDLLQFLDSEYFDDILTKSLNFLTHILEKDDQSKGLFYKGLVTVIGQFSSKILLQKVLPPLLSELRTPILVPFILPNIFIAARCLETSDSHIFKEKIFSSLIPLFTIKEPFQILLLLLQHIDYIASRIDASDIKNHVVPLLCTSLEHPAIEVQIGVLKMTPEVIHLIDYDIVKNNLLPRLQTLLLTTTSQHVRINALLCFSKIVHVLAKNVIEETILPTLAQCLNCDRSSVCLMGVTGVCDAISKKFGEQITAHRLLPLIIPFSVNESLNLNQFETYLVIVKGMLRRIEEVRRKQLEERKKLDEENVKIDQLPDAQKFTKFTEFVANDNVKKNVVLTLSPLASSGEKQTLNHQNSVPASSSSLPSDFGLLIKQQEEAKEYSREQTMQRTLIFFSSSGTESSTILSPSSSNSNQKSVPSATEASLSQIKWTFTPSANDLKPSDATATLLQFDPLTMNSNTMTTNFFTSSSQTEKIAANITNINTVPKNDSLSMNFSEQLTTTRTTTYEPKTTATTSSKIKLKLPTTSKQQSSVSTPKTTQSLSTDDDINFNILTRDSPPLSTSTYATSELAMSSTTSDAALLISLTPPPSQLQESAELATVSNSTSPTQPSDFSWFDSAPPISRSNAPLPQNVPKFL